MDEPDGIGLADAIDALQAELALAHDRAAGHAVSFPIESLTIELQVAVTKSADGHAGVKVPVFGVDLGAGGGIDRARTQTVTLVLAAPVDQAGRPVKVSERTDTRLGN